MGLVKMAEMLSQSVYYNFLDYHICSHHATVRYCATPIYSAGLTHGSTPTTSGLQTYLLAQVNRFKEFHYPLSHFVEKK